MTKIIVGSSSLTQLLLFYPGLEIGYVRTHMRSLLFYLHLTKNVLYMHYLLIIYYIKNSLVQITQRIMA
jgi:hypothetical protein